MSNAENLLSCKAAQKGGWVEGRIMIRDHTFCDDFVGNIKFTLINILALISSTYDTSIGSCETDNDCKNEWICLDGQCEMGYVLSKRGELCSRDGYMAVHVIEVCEDASKKLRKDFSARGRYSEMPKGCVLLQHFDSVE